MTDLRLVLATQWYDPEPIIQPSWIAQALRRRGVEVDVLTGIPNYPAGIVSPGYSCRRRSTESIDGVVVHRTPLYPSHDGRVIRRFLNYASWALSSAVLGQRLMKSADVVLVYSSPATAAFPAMVARRMFGTPYVLLVQDVWPDSIFASGFLPGRLGDVARRVVGAFASRAYAKAARIVVISPGMAGLLESRGVASDKIELAYNWVDGSGSVDAGARASIRAELGLSAEDFVVMYAGNHGAAQGLAAIIDAFSRMSQADRCHLVLVGDGMEKSALRAQADQGCPDRVHFMPARRREQMLSLMSAADVQLVSLVDTPLFAVTTPSKLQSVLAAGQPVLVSATGDATEIVRAAGAGAAVRPGDADELVAAIHRLRELTPGERAAMGRRGRAYYDSHMSEEAGSSRLLSALRRAAATGGNQGRRQEACSGSANDRMRLW